MIRLILYCFECRPLFLSYLVWFVLCNLFSYFGKRTILNQQHILSQFFQIEESNVVLYSKIHVNIDASIETIVYHHRKKKTLYPILSHIQTSSSI